MGCGAYLLGTGDYWAIFECVFIFACGQHMVSLIIFSLTLNYKPIYVYLRLMCSNSTLGQRCMQLKCLGSSFGCCSIFTRVFIEHQLWCFGSGAPCGL